MGKGLTSLTARSASVLAPSGRDSGPNPDVILIDLAGRKGGRSLVCSLAFPVGG